MTEQDDLFGKETETLEGELDSKAADTTGSESDATRSEPVSVNEETDTDIAGSGIATGEVRAVDPPAQSGRPYLLLGLLLLALIGGGYVLLGNKMPASFESGQEKGPSKRYTIDKKVEVEIVEQQQVAKVETEQNDVVTPAAENTVAETETTASQPQEDVQQQVVEKQPEPLPPPVEEEQQYQVLVGPYLSKTTAGKVKQQLTDLGFDAEMTKGRGIVTMIRLLEGVYQKEDVAQRLTIVRKVVKDAFKLPVGDKWAIYVGSFSDKERAEKYVATLAEKGVLVTPVASDVELSGRMLLIAKSDKESAQQAVEQISTAGLSVKQVRK